MGQVDCVLYRAAWDLPLVFSSWTISIEFMLKYCVFVYSLGAVSKTWKSYFSKKYFSVKYCGTNMTVLGITAQKYETFPPVP